MDAGNNPKSKHTRQFSRQHAAKDAGLSEYQLKIAVRVANVPELPRARRIGDKKGKIRGSWRVVKYTGSLVRCYSYSFRQAG